MPERNIFPILRKKIDIPKGGEMHSTKNYQWIIFIIVLLAVLFVAPGTNARPEELSLFQIENLSFLSSVSAQPELACHEVCTERVPPGCRLYGSTWDECACVRHETVCDNPPDPTISATPNCSVTGSNGWCIGTFSLGLSATEPDGENVLISGDVGGDIFSCGPTAGEVSCAAPLPEGTGTANYLATSAQGTTAGGSYNWKYDATLPVIAGQVDQSPNANNWFNTNITVTASASDASPGSGLASFETSLDELNWVTYADPLSFNEGTRTLYLRATDTAGNIETINLALNVDIADPVLSRLIGGLSGSNGWYSSAITVSVSATDNLSGVARLETTLDSSTWTPYSAPLNLGDGVYPLQMQATDFAGNQASIGETLKVDTTAPSTSVSLSGTQGSANWYSSAASVSISATDATSGIASLVYDLNGAGWTAYSLPLILGDGVHSLTAQATDIAGHVQTVSKTVYVDTSAPLLELYLNGGTSFLGWQATEVEISAAASDATSGLSSFEISVDGGDWESYAAPFMLGDGSHIVEARAIDSAGNQVTLSKTVNVDTRLPGISIDLAGTAGRGDWFVSAVVASATASAPGSGVASFEYALAGGAWQTYSVPLQFTDGVQILYLRATNNAGLIREVTQVIKVDTLAPSILLPEVWTLEDYIYYELEDANSGLDSLRMVLEDDAERWQKAVFPQSLSGHKHAASFQWDGKWGDGNYAIPGTYYACLKVSDVAGNEGVRCATITVPTEGGVAPVVIIPTEPPAPAEEIIPDEQLSEEAILITTRKETSFPFGSKTATSVPSGLPAETANNIAWGATASAAIGAFAAEIVARKRREEEAAAASRQTAIAKRAEHMAKRGFSKPEKLSYNQIAKAYQAALDNFKQSLVAGGFSAKEAAAQRNAALLNGKIQSAKEVIDEYRTKKAEQEARVKAGLEEMEAEKKIGYDDPKLPKEPSYVLPDMSWKRDDYARLEHAKEVAEANKQEDEKSWWENAVDWVDGHQIEVSLGIGVAVGIAAIVLSGGAATPFVAVAWIASSAVVAGTAAAVGTMALNAYYGRSPSENIWRNLGLAAGGAALTSGSGFLLAGGGLQAGVYKVGNSITSLCVQHPTACARVSSAFSLWDTIETAGLRAKLAVQTAQGNPAAADTLLEIQLEQADGGIPGNTTIREITENITTLFGKHGDESLKLAEAFAHHGDEIAEIGENGIIRLKDDVADFAETLNKIERDLKDVNPNIRVYKSPENGTFYVSQPSREALEALTELQDAVKSGKSDAEIDLLIHQFAETTAHGDDELVWLGAWWPGGDYINEALRRDGFFYDVGGDEVWRTLEGLGTRNGPDGPSIAQEVNLSFIQQQGDAGREFLFKAPGNELNAIETYLLDEDTAEALIVLGNPNGETPDRWLEAKKLMDLGFNYEIVTENKIDYMWWHKP